MKIGFRLTGGDEWQAGISYLSVLLHALRQSYEDRVKICLLAPGNKSRALEDLSPMADEVLPIPTFRRWTISWGIDCAMKRTFSRDLLGARILRRHKIDAVFGLCMQCRYDGIPTLSWVYDFQHVHMPEMFSLQERLMRDWVFSQTARLSTRIIVTSDAVKKDFDSFFPKYAHKAKVLKTASYIPQSVYEIQPQSITRLYQLPEKFVYLPNQFWKHKNHELAFEAVKLLKDRGIEVFVVCSGYQGDYRHPDYFTDLLRKVSDWRIGDQIKLLGLVPRDHVFQLMRQSVCVLNPSLFEGLGLSVDEGRSIGKKLLLSDIPAHREQCAPQSVFFDPRNLEDLAEKLKAVWHDTLPGPHAEFEIEARESFPQRSAACAESFMAVVREVASG